jgi:RNA polymerase sigma-70 factor (ECF subfamily)
MPIEIENVLKMISEDNRRAFDVFYNYYYEQVFRFAYSFLKNKEACRDVVTDVFVSFWQSRKRLKDVLNIETYLYISVRNESNRYLAEKKHRFVSLDEIPLHLESDESESPENDLVIKEMDALLKQAVDELSEKCRTVFLMAREQGMKPKQIAEILSIQESTVRVQMKIAIDKIMEVVRRSYPNLSLITFLVYVLKHI